MSKSPKRQSSKQSKVRLRPNESIGDPAAEDDTAYLQGCFVALPILNEIKDLSKHKCLVLGRTGSGKSALLYHIEATLHNVSRVVPKDASFQFVTNTTIVQVLQALGVDLYVFYEYLWKHIICVHIIRECLGVKNEETANNMFRRLEAFVTRDRRKLTVVEYLKKHRDHFWETADVLSQEVTTSISDKISSSLGIKIDPLSGQFSGSSDWKEEERNTIKSRAQVIVNAIQMRELNETISALSELISERQTTFYVIVDNLDENWSGSEANRYSMLRALIESLKTFWRIPNLKIVVALREDVFESMLRDTPDRHFQPEKLEGMICRIRWHAPELLQVVETRLNKLFKSRYSSKGVSIDDVLPAHVWEDGVRNFLVERTLRRPRDIISLVNKILAVGGDLPLPSRAATSIEASYARERLDALHIEWRSCHPLLRSYLAVFKGRQKSLRLQDVGEARLSELVLEIAGLERPEIDSVERAARLVYDSTRHDRFAKLAATLVCCLFKTGAIGVKLSPELPFKFCYDEASSINETELNSDCRVMVHPMLASALGGAVYRQAEEEAA